MVWVPGGPFWMGSEEDPESNAPVHRVAVSGFWMDKTEVTNAQFEAFVTATGYKTVAELPPSEEDLEGQKVAAREVGAVFDLLCPGQVAGRSRPKSLPADLVAASRRRELAASRRAG